MAGNSNFTLYTQVQFDSGAAVKSVKALKGTMDTLKTTLQDNIKLLADMKNGAVAASQEQIKAQENVVKASRAAVKAQGEAIKQQVTDLSMLRKASTELEKMSLNQLKKAQREAQKKMDSIKPQAPGSQKELQGLKELMTMIETRTKELRSGFTNLWNAATTGAKMSMPAMQDLINIIEKDGQALAKNEQHYRQMLALAQKLKTDLAGAKGFNSLEQAINGGNAAAVTTARLQEYIKFYQQIASSAQSSAKQVQDAEMKIQKAQSIVTQRTISQPGEKLVTDVMSNKFTGTVKETEQAIEKIQLYKKELSTTNVTGIEDANQAIAKLKEELNKLNESASNGKRVLADFETNQSKAFEGKSAQQLEKMRADLEAYKKTLGNTEENVPKLQKITAALKSIDSAQLKLNRETVNFKDLLERASTGKASLNELRTAYKLLKAEVENMSRSQQGYNEKAAQLRKIDLQIKQMTQSMGHHVTSLQNAASRLGNYVAIYLGFNTMLMKTQQAIRNIIDLSDQMTNVQKVSGLTAEQTIKLTDAIQHINTRTANSELMAMAENAGKLGIATQKGTDGVIGFVKAGEQIVNTLGEIGGAQSIAELLKVNDVVNKNGGRGVEEDLMRIGSAVLSIGNNSKASYAHVVDFTKTMGAVGSTAGWTMPQIMALAGTFDSLGGNMDSSATAMQRVLIGLITNTEDVAKAANVSTKQLRELIHGGDSFGALKIVLEAISTDGVEGVNKFLKAIGGRNNTQAKSALTLLSQNVDILNNQLRLANLGYEDGTLVTQEFEKANNNLAGTMKQISNEFYEMFATSSAATGVFLDVSKGFLEVVRWFKEVNGIVLVLTATITALTLQFMKNTAAAITNGAAQQGLAGMVGGVLRVFRLSTEVVVLNTKAHNGNAAAAVLATRKTKELKAAMAGNWITLVVLAVTALVAAWMKFNQEAEDAAKRIGEITSAADDEIASLNYLAGAIKKAGDNMEERNRYIDDFNKRFGGYLNNLLTEKSTAYEVAAAYNEAASAIHKKVAEQMASEAESKGQEAHKEEIDTASGKMVTAIKSYANGPQAQKDEAISLIQGRIMQLANQGLSESQILTKIQQEFGEGSKYSNMYQSSIGSYYFKTSKGNRSTTNIVSGQYYKGGATGDFYGAMKDYISAQVAANRDAEVYRAGSRAYQSRASYDELSRMTNIRKALESGKLSEDDQIKFIGEYLELNKKYKNDKRNKRGKEFAPKYAKQLNELVAKRKTWGVTSGDWSMMGGEDLATVIDFFDKVMHNYREGMQLTEDYIVPTGVNLPQGIDSWSKDNIVNWARKQWEEASKVMAEKDYANRQGHFKDFPDGSDKSDRRKDYIDLARKRIEEYYKQIEETYTVALNNGKMMQSDYNALVFANTQKLRQDQVNLEQKFLDTSHRFSNENVDKFMQSAEGPNGEMINIDYGAINSFLGTDKGKKYLGTINLNIDKYAAEIQKAIRDKNEQIEKALLSQRPIAKLAQEWLADLNELSLLPSTAGLTMDDAVRETAKRLSFLMEEAQKGYALTMDEFMQDMRDNGFGAWADLLDINDKKKSALLLKVKDFSERYEDAVRNMMTTIGKRVDQEWAKIDEKTGKSLNQKFTDAARGITESQQSQSQADSWGFTGRNLEGIGDTDKLKIQQLQQTVNLELERLRIIKERGEIEYANALRLAEAEKDPDARAELFKEAEAKKEASLRNTAEQWEKVQDAQRQATQGHLDQLSNAINQAQPYYETMYAWAEKMGLNMFGSKADRQQASKELLAGIIETTGKMLTQWLVYISTKKMFDQMEVAQEQMKQAQLTAIRYQAMAEQLAATGQEELATLAMQEAANQADQAAAAGKEAAKAGWVGWATGAALTLVMGALMAAASAKVKSAVASATGMSAGKLSTGMLTYAAGMYPTYADGMNVGESYQVQGSDGNTYNARYQPQLTTGKYATPHMGIVGEKGAELIVDHPTLSTLEREAPWAISAIYQAHRYGRLRLNHQHMASVASTLSLTDSRRKAHGVRTFADGNIEDVLGSVNSVNSLNSLNLLDSLNSLNTQLSSFTTLMSAIQRNGIHAKINKYGKGGLMEEIKSGEKFYKSVGK